MGQVTVTIAGKVFRMACDDGQEAHLEKLAHSVDAKINDLRAAFGEIGDQCLTVVAAISMADEASELTRRLAALEQEVASIKHGQGEAAAAVAARSGELAESIVRIAERVEKITDIVEGRDAEI